MHLYCTDTNSVSKRTEMTFHMTHSPRSSIGCVQHDFWSDGTFDTNDASILREDYHYLQTDSNKLPLEPRHREVSSCASKMNVWRKPWTYGAPTPTLSPNGPKWDFTWPTHLGVPWGASKTISVPMVHSVQTVYVYCTTLTLSPNRLKRDSTWPTHQGVLSGASKMIFQAYGTFGTNRTPLLL
jgi:hypothetical protein